jgi:hypothetical protein
LRRGLRTMLGVSDTRCMNDTDTTSRRPSYRAVTRDINVYANCRGINHSDAGEIVTHDRCGAQVVRRDDGRIFDVELSGFYAARKYSCYHGDHECDPALVAATDRARTQALADGEVVKNATVRVVKGRKVPRGTVGRVAWIGDNGWGTQVGLAVDGEVGLKYTAVGNVEVIDRPAPPAPAPVTAAQRNAEAIDQLTRLRDDLVAQGDDEEDVEKYRALRAQARALNAKIEELSA